METVPGPPPPRPVVLAIRLVWASAALSVIAGIAVALGWLDVPGEEFGRMGTLAMEGMGALIAVLLAWKVSARRSWARWTLAALAFLGIAGLVASWFVAADVADVFQGPVAMLGMLQSVFQLACVGLLFLPQSSRWFASEPRHGANATRTRTAAATAGALLAIFAASIVAGIIAFLLAPPMTHDPDRRAEKMAIASPQHPYAGFWKTDCSEDFGLAIAPAGPARYSVSFCGPGGCFKPGSYRPDTVLVGDEAYRVIGADAIEVKGHDGFSRYVRCERREPC